MADRRMFATCITTSDAFLDMPTSARLLYFDLGMRADDDGFVGSPKRIMRETGASEDDLTVLLAKRFVLGFPSGVVVIKHWRINNYLRNDRYKPTVYKDELAALNVKDNKAYTMKDAAVYQRYTNGIPNGYQMDTNGIPSIGKDSKGKLLTPPTPPTAKHPTLEDVKSYMEEANLTHFTAEQFVSYYESNGWKVGKNPMKDWKAACRSWEQRKRKEGGADDGNVYAKLW